jgi:hypothetical protein
VVFTWFEFTAGPPPFNACHRTNWPAFYLSSPLFVKCNPL